MNHALVSREPIGSFAAAGAVLAAAILLLLVVILAPLKWTAAIVGSVACLTAAYLSGNPRLFFLWGLILTLPLSLSKYFGDIYWARGSGEIAFRIELSDVFLGGLAAFLARDIWVGSRSGLRVPKVTYFWIGIMLMGCFAIVFGRYQYAAAHEVFRMFKVMILFLVICNELERPRRILHCGAALMFAVIVQSTVGLIQYFTKSGLGLEILGETDPKLIEILGQNSVYGAEVWRVSGLMLHPNLFGNFLAVLLPLAISLFLLRTGKGYKLVFLSAIILGTASLIWTLSRASWLSFAGAFALLLFLLISHQGLRRRSLLATAAATMALSIIAVTFAGPIMTRVFQSREASAIGRAQFNQDAKRMIAVKPWFGWGLNNYINELPPYTKFSLKAFGGNLPPVHNSYYLWWAETGIVGLALHLSLMAGIIWVGVGNLRVHDELLFAVNAACLSGILAYMIDAFLSYSLRLSPNLRVFWVVAGIIMAIHYWRLRHAASGPSLEQAGSRVV